ncbi:MAG TPA: DnaJ domain-containing protein [Xanthobacteraceae bacterium]|nr:DnaJ domain-containing protein [Xanthobacteraceae bacterium]
MKFDSPLYDRIRVKPTEDRRLRADRPCCDWPNCAESASHRAPKGRNREHEYWRFCLQHVREYNQSYNFFAGMSDDAVARYQKDALTGHLPTWRLGTIGGNGRGKAKVGRLFVEGISSVDPFDILRELGGAAQSRAEAERRTVRNAERKALHALGLEDGAAGRDVKARFKELVKRHHPDANGGDRASEDKLREIIEAYNYLKKTGFC